MIRRGRENAVLPPGGEVSARYRPLVARGVVRLKGTTAGDLDLLPELSVPADVSPLDLLLEERAQGER